MKAFLAQCKGARIPVRQDVPLSEYSTFRIGGRADIALFPATVEQLCLLLSMLEQSGLAYCVIGKGSNVLFSDAGFRGAVVFTTEMNQFRFDADTLYAQSGARLGQVCAEACRQGYEGFAFGCGIPGTVGGGVYMNAGAYGGCISDVLLCTEYYDCASNRIRTMSYAEHAFDYRHSIFAEHPEYVILGSTFALRQGNAQEIMQRVREQAASRREKQPLSYPSVGSTFKRPAGHFAGKLIEDAGLKGTRVGDAVVSDKHAGFIVNDGHATAADVLALVALIKSRVYQQFGVELECEFKYIGD